MDDKEIIDPYEQLASAWDDLKQALWDEFTKSRIGKFIFWLADKLSEWLER